MFLSLTFTLAVLVVTAIGADKLLRSGQTAWTRVSAKLENTLLLGGARMLRSEGNTAVRGVSEDSEDTEQEGQAIED